jgi:hypothetical protein
MGYDDYWIDDQAPQFRDHHLKTEKLFTDWNACWRTWVQKAPNFQPNGKGNGTNPHKLSPVEKLYLGAARAAEAIAARERIGEPPAFPLLDSQRSPGDPPGTS